MYTANGREGFGDFEIGGQVIRTVTYPGEIVLQGMIDRLSEVGRYCGMEINVKKL